MKVRNLLLATAGMALTVGIAGAVMAQNKPAPAGAMESPATRGAAAPHSRDRHLLFIAKHAQILPQVAPCSRIKPSRRFIQQ